MQMQYSFILLYLRLRAINGNEGNIAGDEVIKKYTAYTVNGSRQFSEARKPNFA